MRIEEELKLDYSDVLFRPKRSTLKSRKDVNLLRTYRFKYSKNEWSGIPIMAANMDGVGELSIAEKLNDHGMITCLTKQHDVKKIKQNKDIKKMYSNIALSVGIKKEDFQNLDKVLKEFSFFKFICIDVANGYTEHFTNFIKSVRDKYPTKTIIAGNVVTADMTQELVLSGADIVKVGIGPGSVCTTRIKTGVGYPQLSAVIECADAAHGLGGHIIADGGCSTPGDISKAFGAGADFVMLGGMLSGTDQGGGKVVDGKVEFYGMSSTESQKRNSNVKDYRASEGRVVRVGYKGSVEPIIRDILGGLRSSCTYVGASALKELPKRTTFVRIASGDTHNRIYESSTTGE